MNLNRDRGTVGQWRGFLIGCLIVCAAMSPITAAAEQLAADVVIYGGTSAGVSAAIQVDRQGHSVILIEPGQHLGGLTSGGLGFTDSGNKAVIGGIAREFYQAIKAHYDQPTAWVHERADEYARYRASEDAMWTFEPHVAEATFRRMLAQTSVQVMFGERLNRQQPITLSGLRIQSIPLESGKEVAGHMFIDATYEGDLMAAAGVPFTVGREANSVYDETLNGNQVKANTHNHRFLKDVSPYLIAGQPESGLLPMIEDAGAGTDGTGDARIQAYCFRMCMSRVPENRVPFPKPADYDETQYELLFRNFEAGDLRFPMKPDMMPNGKTDTNNNCAVSTDFIGGNYDYPEAGYAERERIIRAHESWQEGLMWTLANHPRIPAVIREQMRPWGLARDEFVDNGHWPHQLYVRESRRMVSDYVMTEWDCRRARLCDDSVGLGSYNMDSHNVRRYVTDAGFVQNEGDVQVSPGGAYLISYKSIVPADGHAQNLLVPVCLSASHIAYGSIRMEPVFMILGQSAATAAVQALADKCSVQDVDYAKLRERLVSDKQVLDLPPQSKARRLIRAASVAGQVIDETRARLEGDWTFSTSTPNYVETGYVHDADTAKGQSFAVFRIPVDATGTYDVRMSYSAHSNRATNVPVRIDCESIGMERTVNQRLKPSIDDLFHPLAVIEARRGSTIVVTVANAETDGHVIVDAVQVVLRDNR